MVNEYTSCVVVRPYAREASHRMEAVNMIHKGCFKTETGMKQTVA